MFLAPLAGSALLQGLSAAVGVAGALFSGISGYAAAKYQAQVAEINAKVANANAARSAQAGSVEAQANDMKVKAQLGTIDATQGASGISLASGTTQRIRRSAAQLGRQDTENVRYNADVRTHQFKVDAVNSENQGKLARMQATSSLLSGFINAGSSLIGSAKGMVNNFAPGGAQPASAGVKLSNQNMMRPVGGLY